MMEKVIIDGVEVHLGEPDEVPMTWVGQEELVTQVQAAWLMVGEEDLPLHPRLVGKPGVGKQPLPIMPAGALTCPFIFFRPPWIPGPRT